MITLPKIALPKWQPTPRVFAPGVNCTPHASARLMKPDRDEMLFLAANRRVVSVDLLNGTSLGRSWSEQ
ncbi:hypothetical protein [Mesorhizobium sp. SARCC-RB16n]|uniref:hypothetical protein n=1 Tax=Mesorhizobium sp. SARCC-RB16n TaxID=2116687 RepID=UPI001AED56D8|nr:hypothetical protein [Mesorhizobium sp. SARCC-RB16n]